MAGGRGTGRGSCGPQPPHHCPLRRHMGTPLEVVAAAVAQGSVPQLLLLRVGVRRRLHMPTCSSSCSHESAVGSTH